MEMLFLCYPIYTQKLKEKPEAYVADGYFSQEMETRNFNALFLYLCLCCTERVTVVNMFLKKTVHICTEMGE
jgi:hypothetical protein